MPNPTAEQQERQDLAACQLMLMLPMVYANEDSQAIWLEGSPESRLSIINPPPTFSLASDEDRALFLRAQSLSLSIESRNAASAIVAELADCRHG